MCQGRANLVSLVTENLSILHGLVCPRVNGPSEPSVHFLSGNLALLLGGGSSLHVLDVSLCQLHILQYSLPACGFSLLLFFHSVFQGAEVLNLLLS